MFLQTRRVNLRAQDLLCLGSSVFYRRQEPLSLSQAFLSHLLWNQHAFWLTSPPSPSLILILPCSRYRLWRQTSYSSAHPSFCLSSQAPLSSLLAIFTLSFPFSARLHFEFWNPFIFSAPHAHEESERPAFISQLCMIPALCPWAQRLNFLSLSFLTHELQEIYASGWMWRLNKII